MGGGKLVVGVRFTLVRLAPLDIPGIPTSGMLEAPPSSSSHVGGCGELAGLSCCCTHTDGPLWSLVEQKPHTPLNLGRPWEQVARQTAGHPKSHQMTLKSQPGSRMGEDTC